MTDPQPAPIGGWRVATVESITHPTSHGVMIRLAVPDRVDHLPGQHYVVRLTAPDGYRAQRSYSLASAPSDSSVELYVERLPDGEVSTYLADELRPGDMLDVRGPIGGWFVWRGDGPALGVAGGSGVVPLIAMLRHAADLGCRELMSLAVSARTLADLPFRDELIAAGATVILTREAAPSGRAAARIAPADVQPLIGDGATTAYVCGSSAFAEAASTVLMDAGVSSDHIRVERFGPSG